jgi:hypothetical protein
MFKIKIKNRVGVVGATGDGRPYGMVLTLILKY